MSLPLKAKLAIRDHWTPDTSASSKAVAELRELLGLSVACEPEWPLLVAELDPAYPDKQQLVLAVAGCVQAWCRAAAELLDTDEAWADEMLEKVRAGPTNTLKISVEVSKSDAPSTAWSPARNGFILSLPATSISNPLEHIPLFKTRLLSAFTPAAAPSSGNPPADDWTDVVVTNPVPVASSKKQVEYLVDPETLARPDDFLLQPPYYLTVYSRGMENVEVQSSHGPSLEVLAGYYKKWRRSDNNRTDRPPLIDVTLHQSPLGLGLIHDTLTLSADNSRYGSITRVSPMPVLSLVESVLGYERIYCEAGTWHFRKDGPLKKF